jgi:hypothetical protein
MVPVVRVSVPQAVEDSAAYIPALNTSGGPGA